MESVWSGVCLQSWTCKATLNNTLKAATHTQDEKYLSSRTYLNTCVISLFHAYRTALHTRDLHPSEFAVWLGELGVVWKPRPKQWSLNPFFSPPFVRVGSVAGRIGGVMPTIYGQFWDVKTVANPINCAYTNHALDLHQDLAYYESPPGIQLLHCVRFDEGIKGGDSTFVDSFLVAERLR
jgi:alpha-ketoglutarate-dependent taurine dioxygenase